MSALDIQIIISSLSSIYLKVLKISSVTVEAATVEQSEDTENPATQGRSSGYAWALPTWVASGSLLPSLPWSALAHKTTGSGPAYKPVTLGILHNIFLYR